MFKISKTKKLFAGLVLISLITLGYAEWMVYKDTTKFLESYFIQVIQEDNSFFQ